MFKMWYNIKRYFYNKLFQTESDQLARLKLENINLRNRVKDWVDKREKVGIELGDPLPEDTKKRKSYVSMVAGLHDIVLRKKLLQMIDNAREVLENTENNREQDLETKGVIFCLWELIRWGDKISAEDKANKLGEDPSSDEDKTKN